MKKFKANKFLLLFIIIAALAARDIYIGSKSSPAKVEAPKTTEMNFTGFMDAASAGKIKTATIRANEATGDLTDGGTYNAEIIYDPATLTQLGKSGVSISIDSSTSFWEKVAMFFPLIIGILFIYLILRGPKMMAGGGIPGMPQMVVMRANGEKKKKATTFKDVAGIDDAKKEVEELIDFLKKPSDFTKLGARLPRGVLLSGAPGTGKTLLARAIAGEAKVPFFASSGSEFSGILVGLGVSKVRDLFKLAKSNSPCILFIDEIDAIGQKRGKGSMSDHDREQTLNQLLIEMDGFANNSGVIVIAATNRPDILDGALLRPGRFDRQVHIDLPNRSGRLDILKIYAAKLKLDKSVDLDIAARGTPGFSGAELENLMNEAALIAVRRKSTAVSAADLDMARDKVLMGPEKSMRMSENDRKIAAYHEAGHAMLSVHFKGVSDPILKATIIPRGRALGMVQHLPVDDKNSMNLAEIRANLAIYMAGRASEEIFIGKDKITTGATADIAAATNLARHAVVSAGLSPKLGMIAVNETMGGWGIQTRRENVSDKTAELVDAEIKSLIDSAYKIASAVLGKNKPKMKKLAEALLKRETLTADEIEKVLK
ncbi:MAG: ATP-dependent zinc metalloprotease FtsH [Rickettsiales bacterium]|jgi:cell division protease FtsH|nr:ATP-dependent zinc metalloprotease FtsH [Rickettsiales bacterium]